MNTEDFIPIGAQLEQDQEKAIRGDAVPRLLEDSKSQAALVRGIRLHYDFAMSEPVRHVSASMPLFARARNARRIMSDDIPEQMRANEQPYCICYPDIATENTYRSLASRFPDMKYQVGRACAAAGYYALYKELELLPEVSIAEEARESETEGGKLIYEEIMGFKYRYAIMDDCKRSINLADFIYPAYLNGDTEVRWRLATRNSIKRSRVRDLLPCIEEDSHLGLEDQDVDERHSMLTEDEVELLYTVLPQDLPTVKKTLLIQMAAYSGNIERYARLANSGRTLTPIDEDCIIRGILHHNMFARWWADQIKNNTIYAKSAPYIWELQRAILTRRIMLNDLSLFESEDNFPSEMRKPYIIWWPLKPDEQYLNLLAEKVPEMKTAIAAAAIACDYVDLYKWLDPEPSWHLWVVASEFSPNPFYREDQERRGREQDVDVEDGRFEHVEYRELAKTREVTVLDIYDERKNIRDGVEKRQIWGKYDEIFNTSVVQLRTWDGVGRILPEL
ncbi:hypothetical protein FLONG3_8815 [Fusarium longipes]|uniref:Uncharacterized protein n=1 Tax=Fusarium longipes TaxID=694270 RepID=A0A395S2J7_9HYPO|nr:hypothetical protein FLONG3_8815 [Fusarium longipes]